MQKSELEMLWPESNKLTLAGETVSIRPFPFGKWPEILKRTAGLIEIILEDYRKHGDAVFSITTQGDKFNIAPEAFQTFMRLITEGSGHIFDILAIGAGKPREWVENLDVDEGIVLLASTFMVNKDFFTEHVLPKFRTITEGRQLN